MADTNLAGEGEAARAAVPVASGRSEDTATERRRADRTVVRDALGVGVAVGLSGFAFGVTAAGAGLSLLQSCALSLLVFTGASQFALVGTVAAGGTPLAAVAGALFLGVRNAFYGLRLSSLLQLPAPLRPLAAQWVIDETSVVTFAQRDRRSARIGFFVTGATLYVLWNLSTLLGVVGASALGDTAAWGLDAAGPAVFLALLAPMLRTVRERATAVLAVLLGLVLVPVLPGGVPVLISGLAAPVVLLCQRARFGGAPVAGSVANGEAAAPSVVEADATEAGPVVADATEAGPVVADAADPAAYERERER